MCEQCWRDHGAPRLYNAKVQAAADAIARVYELSIVGGNAHVVVDDFNIDDGCIDWNLGEGLDMNVHKHGEAQIRIERDALEKLRALSLAERASALGLHDGYWKP
jgi:hypothetical protein